MYEHLRERVFSRLMIQPDGCLVWMGARQRQGYGHVAFRLGGRLYARKIHRLMYEWFVEPIPDGLDLDHLCRNRPCACPDHLEPVTRRENTLRGETLPAAQLARTHCPKNHPYDEANTQFTGRKRSCRACGRAAARERAALRKAGALPPVVHTVTHCKRGHEYTPDNTYISPGGDRACRRCKAEAQAKARAAAKVAGRAA